MNVKQKRFCDEYLIDCNITQAAIRAGYSPKGAYKTGRRILETAEGSEYVNSQLKKLHDERTADAYEVLEYLTSVMRGESREQRLKLAGDGVQKVVRMEVPAKDRIRAAELIGKRFGLFKEKVEVDKRAAVVILGEGEIPD